MRQRMRRPAGLGGRQGPAMVLAGLVGIFLVMMAALPDQLQAASQITEVLLSDQTDASGVVTTPKTTFTPQTTEIKGTALIAGAQKGQKIKIDLFYMTKNLKVLSAYEDISAAGEITFNFAFPKPEKGWPKGDYKVVISTSDRATKEVPFQVK